jgi:hypothetical protein
MKTDGRAAAESIFGFAAQVAAIHAAIEAGEDIRLKPSTLETLRDAFQILMSDMQRRE